MDHNSSDMTELHQISFSSEVLARIAPEEALERHLAVGLRPNLRNANEFRGISVSTGGFNKFGDVLGSSTLHAGGNMVICTIQIGIIEEAEVDAFLTNDDQDKFSPIYPSVEVARGRSGAPTDEEMILSQRLYETMYHSKIIPSSSLKFKHGIYVSDGETNGKVYYSDINKEDYDIISSGKASRKYSFVLGAHIKVFSRTGPLFDLCYQALAYALKNVRLPRIYISNFNSLEIPLNARGRFSRRKTTPTKFNIDRNSNLSTKLVINEDALGVCSNFGIKNKPDFYSRASDTANDVKMDTKPGVASEPLLLADLDGECEESAIFSKINVIANEDHLKSISVLGTGDSITLESLRKALDTAKLRATNFDVVNNVTLT